MDEVKPERPYSAKSFFDNLSPSLSQEMDSLPLSEIDVEVKSLISLAEAALMGADIDEAIELFDRALKIIPQSASLYIKQGGALLNFGSESFDKRALLIAAKKFSKASELDSSHFSSWHLWGKTLLILGTNLEEKHFFLNALEKLNQAHSLSTSKDPSVQAEFFWDIAKVKYQLACFSKEPIDLHEAISFFEKAADLSSLHGSIFWDEYGIASMDLFTIHGDIKLLVRAIQLFKAALTRSGSPHHLAWKHLAKALRLLYEHTHDEEHFIQSSECYSAASHIFPGDSTLLIDAIEMKLSSARQSYDEKKALSAIELCQKALDIDASTLKIECLWAEALCLIGERNDQKEPLIEGQNRVDDLLEKVDNDPSLLLSLGLCLDSLARYYDDIDLHYLAVEKFQAGLSINRNLSAHWRAIGASYYEIGRCTHDAEALEKSVFFLYKALQISPRNSYISFELSLSLARLGEYKLSPEWLQKALEQFERTISLQKNAYYAHPQWLYHYAKTLDLYGDFHDEESYYAKAIELLAHVLIVNPTFPGAHHQMGVSFCHLAQLTHHIDHFYKALQHLKVAAKEDEHFDLLLVDQAITLIHIALLTHDSAETELNLSDAEIKLTQAAKAGCLTAYYQLACLFSIQKRYDLSLFFLEKCDTYHVLPSLDDLLEDEWLDGVRTTSEWKDFFLKIENKRNL